MLIPSRWSLCPSTLSSVGATVRTTRNRTWIKLWRYQGLIAKWSGVNKCGKEPARRRKAVVRPAFSIVTGALHTADLQLIQELKEHRWGFFWPLWRWAGSRLQRWEEGKVTILLITDRRLWLVADDWGQLTVCDWWNGAPLLVDLTQVQLIYRIPRSLAFLSDRLSGKCILTRAPRFWTYEDPF